jgi:hypothetical protein
MPAPNVPKSALQRETERQNRIHQEAIEKKKKQMRQEDGRTDSQFAGNIPPKGAVSKQRAGDRQEAENRTAGIIPTSGTGDLVGRVDGSVVETNGLTQEGTDRLRHIPDMRSALIPLTETSDSSEWSKPFSLSKADMEPWLSFYKGYKQSRLFLETASSQTSLAEEENELSLDFAVRALLELKQVSTKVILEPPVQINGLVSYLDMQEELGASRDSLQAMALLKIANNAHEELLRKAFEKGRIIGNLLHDTLMGEGHVNLIKAWENKHNRKPTVAELHLMLTTGRLKPSPQRTAQMPEAGENPEQEKIASNVRQNNLSGRQEPVFEKELPRPSQLNSTDTEDSSLMEDAPEWKQERGNRGTLLWAFFAAVVCAAIVAYGWSTGFRIR